MTGGRCRAVSAVGVLIMLSWGSQAFMGNLRVPSYSPPPRHSWEKQLGLARRVHSNIVVCHLNPWSGIFSRDDPMEEMQEIVPAMTDESKRLRLTAEKLKLQAEKIRLEVEKASLYLEVERQERKALEEASKVSLMAAMKECQGNGEAMVSAVKSDIKRVDAGFFLYLADKAASASTSEERLGLVALSEEIMGVLEEVDQGRAKLVTKGMKELIDRAEEMQRAKKDRDLALAKIKATDPTYGNQQSQLPLGSGYQPTRENVTDWQNKKAADAPIFASSMMGDRKSFGSPSGRLTEKFKANGGRLTSNLGKGWKPPLQMSEGGDGEAPLEVSDEPGDEKDDVGEDLPVVDSLIEGGTASGAVSASGAVVVTEEPNKEGNVLVRCAGKVLRSVKTFLGAGKEKPNFKELGIYALLSYGFVSNASYSILTGIAWYISSAKSGLSPLAPDQWQLFMVCWTGLWAMNNLLRVPRFALSISLAPTFDRFINYLMSKTGKGKAVATGLCVFLVNVCGTCTLMAIGIALASLLSGVPFWPVGVAVP